MIQTAIETKLRNCRSSLIQCICREKVQDKEDIASIKVLVEKRNNEI